MNLRLPADLDAKYHLSDHIPAKERPRRFSSGRLNTTAMNFLGANQLPTW